jgi:hypothetical protein
MICVTYGPVPVTKAQYGEVAERLPEPPEGRDYHVCYGEDGALSVTEVWESEEHLDRHNQALEAVLADLFEEPLMIEATIRPVIGIHRPGERGAVRF